MDDSTGTGVALPQPDINSCQSDITPVGLRHLADVGLPSACSASVCSSSDKISYNHLIHNDLGQTTPLGAPAVIEVSRTDESSTFCRIHIRNKGSYQEQIFAILDRCDFERLSDLSWYLLITKQGKRYAVAHGESGRLLYMHREVLGSLSGRITVDHKNGDTLDNRRGNLRVATPGQQRANSRKRGGRTYTSKYKGVSLRQGGGWLARVGTVNVGHFASEEDAARAYDRAAREKFGEYALVNFA